MPTVVSTTRTKLSESAFPSDPTQDLDRLPAQLSSVSLQDINRAEELARDAKTKHPNKSNLEQLWNKVADVAIYNMLGNDAMQEKDYQSALQHFRHIITTNLSYAPTSVFMGLAQLADMGIEQDDFLRLCVSSEILQRFGTELVEGIRLALKNKLDLQDLERGESNARWTRSPIPELKGARPINTLARRVTQDERKKV